MSSFRVVDWIVLSFGLTDFQHDPEKIHVIFSWLRIAGLMLWVPYIFLLAWRRHSAITQLAQFTLTSLIGMYFCLAVGIIVVVAAAVSGFLTSGAIESKRLAAENILMMWVLELLLWWAIGLAIACALKFLRRVFTKADKSNSKDN
jgi:hypothetical protein